MLLAGVLTYYLPNIEDIIFISHTILFLIFWEIRRGRPWKLSSLPAEHFWRIDMVPTVFGIEIFLTGLPNFTVAQLNRSDNVYRFAVFPFL